jgi:hypothetical protein
MVEEKELKKSEKSEKIANSEVFESRAVNSGKKIEQMKKKLK